MYTKAIITSLVLALTGVQAAPSANLTPRQGLPQVSLFNELSCQNPNGSFDPIPTNLCQTISGGPNGPAFGGRVDGNFPGQCTYVFYTDSGCNSTNFIRITNANVNQCFHIIDGQPVGSVMAENCQL
ncbi:hypothetical protein K469DRAFT_754882 [Zopfia rhizophila CBS 207.26]|uniref:Uncharacterized protein n=1 Tax=Zopfia rhizophila CBS 207.26 TaxID=1314779 RepID=A0A6A6DHL3_9PEZI|nr:hypothetical protein K469DRAFT_754882 [Zopfia rhizophila CBS 207.26]